MAIATKQGHVQRAIDFYLKDDKFFVVGGVTPWADESTPDVPTEDDFKLKDIIGYKKVDNCHLVVPDENGTIQYRTQNWRIVSTPYKTSTAGQVASGATEVRLASSAGITTGAKLRIAELYVGTVTSVDVNQNTVTLNTPAPETIPAGSVVEGGALVEGACYVYVDAYLNYDQFPIATYRQIGLCTGVTPDQSILRAKGYGVDSDEFTSKGVLEILDNRPPSTRDTDQREMVSIVCGF